MAKGDHPDDGCFPRGRTLEADPLPTGVVLLSEGEADCRFLRHLLKRKRISGIQVARPVGGKTFEERLSAWRELVSEAATIVVITDSDDDHGAAFKRVADDYRKARFKPPPKVREIETHAGQSRVGAVTIPFDAPGELETLVLTAMSNRHPAARTTADKLIGELPKPPKKLDKVRLAFMIALAFEKNPLCPVSQLWERGDSAIELLDDDCFTALADYLASLVA